MAGHKQRRTTALALLAAAQTAVSTVSAQTVDYSDASSVEKLQSRVGVGIGEESFSVRADMVMVGQDGRTQVLPRVTSEWSNLAFLDVETVVSYEDLNTSADTFEPSIDTNVLLKPSLPFLDRVEGNVRRRGPASQETLKLKFASFDTGLELFGGDSLGLHADLMLQTAGDQAQASSKVTSSWGVGGSVDVKTVMRFDGGATASRSTPTVDTSLVYRSPVSFIDAVEGALQRSASGDLRQSLGIRFPEISAGDEYGTSFEISSKAIVEEMLQADGLQTVSMGVETRVAGFMPPLIGGSNALSLRVDRQFDAREARTSSLAYDHAWSPGDASVGLNLKLLRRLEEVEPSLGITWSTKF